MKPPKAVLIVIAAGKGVLPDGMFSQFLNKEWGRRVAPHIHPPQRAAVMTDSGGESPNNSLASHGSKFAAVTDHGTVLRELGRGGGCAEGVGTIGTLSVVRNEGAGAGSGEAKGTDF